MTIQETIGYINIQLHTYSLYYNLWSSKVPDRTKSKVRRISQSGSTIIFYGEYWRNSSSSDVILFKLDMRLIEISQKTNIKGYTAGEQHPKDVISFYCTQNECLTIKMNDGYFMKNSVYLYTQAGEKPKIRLLNALKHLQYLLTEKYTEVYQDPFDNYDPSSFNKPFYSISKFDYKDQNLNERIDANEEIVISFNLKNSGRGAGKNLLIELKETNNVRGLSFKKKYQINTIQPSQSIKVNLPINSDKLVEINEAQFIIRITENNTLIEELSLLIPTYTTGQTKLIVSKLADVDINIPITQTISNHKYALVIGNEDYKTYQTGITNEVNVKYAENDAVIFSQYLIKTLGVPKDNITLSLNATSAQMKQGLSKMTHLIESDPNAQIIIYFAGHGLPETNTKEQYLIPVDVSGTDLSEAISINEIISDLGQYENGKVIMFLDACFSGGSRNNQLIAQRSVSIKPKPNSVKGSVIIFSASSGTQRSHGYPEKSHGIFTYYFLKCIQENEGNISLGSLADYLNKKVSLKSILLHNEEQTPQIRSSNKIKDSWMNWEL